MEEIRIGTRGCRRLRIVEPSLAARSNRGKVDGRPRSVYLPIIVLRPGGSSGVTVLVGMVARARPLTAVPTTPDSGNGQGVLTDVGENGCTLRHIT